MRKVRCKICNKDFGIIAPNHLAYKHGVSFSKYKRSFPAPEGEYWGEEVRDKQSDNFEVKWRDKTYRMKQKRSTRANTMLGNNNAVRKMKKK